MNSGKGFKIEELSQNEIIIKFGPSILLLIRVFPFGHNYGSIAGTKDIKLAT